MSPKDHAVARRSIVALSTAATLLLAVTRSSSASPCDHPAGGDAAAVAALPTAASGPAVRPAHLPAGHCGHCAPATCAAAAPCGGQTHARPTARADSVTSGATQLATPTDAPGPRSTGPPPDTPPPQLRS